MVVAATVVVGAGVVQVEAGAAVDVDVEVLQTYFLDPPQTTSLHLPVFLMMTQSCLPPVLLGSPSSQDL